MSLFSKLFGGGSGGDGSPRTPEPTTYNGFNIFPEPVREPGGFRLAARIEKEIAGEVKSHRMIRADVFTSEDEARTVSLAKAKIVIDEQGDRLFG